jgi:hypothetical protein
MSSTPVRPAGSQSQKIAARVAITGVEEPDAAVLRDCFRQFGIQSIEVSADIAQRLQREKFEACVLRLHEQAEPILAAARSSPSNRRIVIYGLTPDPRAAMKYSRYGINAILKEPLERAEARKVVRGTYLLVIHELRRYVRLPVAADVQILSGPSAYQAVSQEISAGGMSLKLESPVTLKAPVQVSFTLPGAEPVKVKAEVCWQRENQTLLGVRFDLADKGRQAVKKWIDDYLDAP